MNVLDSIVKTPMGDDTIRKYFPDAKIILYSDLDNYKNLDDLLKDDIDYCFILYEQSPHNGHWVLIGKYPYNNKTFYEYFDSYGGKIDEPLGWNDEETNEELEQDKSILSKLFKLVNGEKIYNNIAYQEYSDYNDINSCGRHCCLRVMFITNEDVPSILSFYYQFMSELSKRTNLNYDKIVSNFINKK
jgi:hypothetical protein